MRRQILPALRVTLLFTVLTGVLYPLLVTGIGQVAFPGAANGSLVERDGEVVGSAWIAQSFTGAAYFHSRPSATGYTGTTGGSSLGPTNEELLAHVDQRATDYRERHGLPAGAEVPVDAVTASGSGWDPHISIANARIQTPGVAEARGLDQATVAELVDRVTARRDLGFLGEPGVNVLRLNLALDDLQG